MDDGVFDNVELDFVGRLGTERLPFLNGLLIYALANTGTSSTPELAAYYLSLFLMPKSLVF